MTIVPEIYERELAIAADKRDLYVAYLYLFVTDLLLLCLLESGETLHPYLYARTMPTHQSQSARTIAKVCVTQLKKKLLTSLFSDILPNVRNQINS